jgi:heme oxygenase
MLKAATQDCHARVDAVFSQAMLSDRRSYTSFLAAQAAAQLPVETALIAGGVADIVPDWPLRERGALLRQDLARSRDPEETWHLKRRIAELTPILTQMNELAELTAHYYDRGYWRNEKYTV